MQPSQEIDIRVSNIQESLEKVAQSVTNTPSNPDEFRALLELVDSDLLRIRRDILSLFESDYKAIAIQLGDVFNEIWDVLRIFERVFKSKVLLVVADIYFEDNPDGYSIGLVA